jgi:di/tricarboxylate transporter
MFEIAAVGFPVAVVGIALMVVLAPRLLPDRRGARQQFEAEVREYVVRMQVSPGGPIEGRTVEAAGLRSLQGVFLVEVERGEEVIAPAGPNTVLRGRDRLIFAGRADLIRDLHTVRGLTADTGPGSDLLSADTHTFYEVVVSGTSPLVGKSLKEAQFRSRYQAAVLAIHRAGERVRAKLGEVKVREGDTLLLIADTEFGARWRHSREFLLLAYLGGKPPVSTRRSLLVGGILLAVVAASAAGLLPVLQASLIGAVALVATRVLSAWEARASIELDVILVIAGSFGVGAAIEASGLASLLGHQIVEAFRSAGPLGVLLAVTLATLLLTELITNNAAAVLMFPIAMSSAAVIGASPRPFAIALAVAASASFLTPIGYQTNTMVYGPGGYRFTDYFRLGLPLTLVVIVMILFFVPIFWPF